MDSSNWQAKLATLKERSKYAFDNSLFSDVEFSVMDSAGNKVNIPANKYTLAVTSPVFAAMFYGQLAENKPVIDLPDCTKEGLHQVLRFASSDEVELDDNNVIEVLFLADKYIIPSLLEECRKYLKKLDVKPEDVLSMLLQFKQIDEKVLLEHFWGIVEAKTAEVVTCESFLDVSRVVLCEVLKRDLLDIDELQLFQAVDKWVTKRIEEKGSVCNGKTKRAILGEEIVQLIRFPLMTQKQFAEIVLPSKILENHELIELFQTFNNVTPETSMFNKKKRGMGDLIIPDNRFQTIEDWVKDRQDHWRFFKGTNSIDAIDFTVNQSVYLVGVVLFGKKDCDYDVDLKIYRNIEMVSLSSSSYYTKHESIIDNSGGIKFHTFSVSLDFPVRLDPQDVCTVYVRINNPFLSYEGFDGNAVVTNAEGFTITYQDSSHNDNMTTVPYGQIPTVLFRKVY